MKFTQEFVVERPPQVVWRFFEDVEGVTRCMPGALLGEVRPDGSYAGEVSVRLGPMTATFEGEATLERDEATRSGRIIGSGADRRGGSRAQVRVDYRLEEVPEGTKVVVDADLVLSGPAAQFGRTGLVREMSNRLAAEFVDCLERKLAAGTEEEAEEVRSGEVRGLSLLFSSLWGSTTAGLRRLGGPRRGD